MTDDVTLCLGDVNDVLPTLEPGFTACFCDPPYGLEFMGKGWDHGVPDADTWRLVYDLLAPGAVLMAFGGTRTWHRLAVAIEDAGFEIFDTLMWLYGSGFPKSHDISKALDREAGAEREVVGEYAGARNGPGRPIYGAFASAKNGIVDITAPATPLAATWAGYGTAMKPAWEPVICARKPRIGTYAQTAAEHGSGALNVDGCRVGTEALPWIENTATLPSNGIYGEGHNGSRAIGSTTRGRWPANLILDEAAAAMLDAQSGTVGGGTKFVAIQRQRNKGWCNSSPGEGVRAIDSYGDTGGASRFFYCAKASRREREAGMDSTCTVKHNVGTGGTALCKALVLSLEKVTSDIPMVKWLIGESGESITGLCPSATLSTTLTAIRKITPSQILHSLMFSPTSESTQDANYAGVSGGNHATSVVSSSPSPQNTGTSRVKDILSTEDVAHAISELLSHLSNAENWQQLTNFHSTVKPLALCEYLARLILPPEAYRDEARLLVPFAGSGSEMIGALQAGWRNVIGVEKEPEYVAIAERRIAYWRKRLQPALFEQL